MEQKRHEDLACDEEPWYLSGFDSSDAEDQSSSSNASSRLATSPAPDYGDDGPALLLFLFVKTFWLLMTGTKLTGILYVWCLQCLSYVDSACNL